MNDLGTQRIETERLILRRFCIEDVEDMYYGWASDPRVSHYLLWETHKDMQETYAILERWISYYENNSYNWAVQCKQSGKLIGNISCVGMNREQHSCEIGYCYGTSHWGHGYATEALMAVINFLLNDCKLHVIEAKHHSLNVASGLVMQKAGMLKEAVLKDRKYNPEYHTYSDLIVYSIINAEA